MSIFEVQVVSGGRWKANNAFEDYDTAYQCAERFERLRQPDQLRIRRIDLIGQGSTRERTMYEGGMKIRREKAAEMNCREQNAMKQRVADRRARRAMAENAASHKNRVFSSNSPAYLTLVSLSIGLTGLSAMYLVEKVFTS